MYSNLAETREVIQSTEKITAIDISPGGNKIIGAGESGNLLIWNGHNYSSESRRVLPDDSHFTSITFMPNEDQVVFGDKKGRLQIFKFSHNAIFHELVGHKADVNSIAFSRSGKLMTTSSNDQTVRIWNLEALNRPPLIIKYDYHPGSLCFSADDTQLLIAQAKGATSNFMIQAWPINFDKISSDLCTLIGRNFTKEEWETFVPSDYPYERVCKDISN